ncbi:AraC family transcriptional regulator [Thalassomonas sp. RHCl1]|uniref:AraC family transcriptional regulator n=1 Tax=Thalassomonas sp. RHCl1 TaxID=2995320 RepID=UPI00248B80AB|nr:AraC family transcriptional regulator [Thalassomonas sp. RHCl1]
MKDIVSEIFSELRLNSHLYFTTEFKGDFGVDIPNEKRLVRFHYVKAGSCYITVPNEGEFHLSKGDLIIIPNGLAQSIKAKPTSLCKPLMDVIQKNGLDENCLKLSVGTEHNTTELLCGYCQYDEDIDHPILSNLSSVLFATKTQACISEETKAALTFLGTEISSGKAGIAGILSRLLEIIFIQSFRESEYTKNSPFLNALRDNKIKKSLSLIHENYQQNWTISSIASEVGMSRARFADKFSKLVGITPIAYLNKWRLMKSRGLLENTPISLELISDRCGFSNASTFSRRFKGEFDITPSAYRKSKRFI